MRRDQLYPDEWTLEYKTNALDLIKRVNNLLIALQWGLITVTSGWRPLAVNQKAGGAPRSLHMKAKAVDLSDKDGTLNSTILKRPELLLDYGLWMENRQFTPTWCHLDCGIRPDRNPRVFNP